VWYSVVATSSELQNNSTLSVDRAFWGPAVLIGILSSCFNAALSSSVVAPRILQALGNHHIVPYADFFAKTHKEEPRNASLFSAVLMLVVLGIGELNLLAVFVTVCFLLTYLTMNSVLLIENQLNLLSFRPTFRVPFWIPLAGTASCLFAIIVISPFWGFTSILLSMSLYIYLDYRGLQSPWETVHGGLFENIAYWISRKVMTSKRKSGFRAWI